MKKTFLYVLGITGLACLLLTSQPTLASVYGQFKEVTTRNFVYSPLKYPDFRLPDSLQDSLVVLDDGYSTGAGYVPANNRFRNYSSTSGTPDGDLDDGLARIPLGFSYGFNGHTVDSVFVSINGYVTIGSGEGMRPSGPGRSQSDPMSLFITDMGGSRPCNVIAPYWGNHKYWPNLQVGVIDQGRTPSQIGYVHGKYEAVDSDGNIVNRSFCLIQWKDLNINWQKEDEPDIKYNGNVASFQLIIYQGVDASSLAGNVEFRYNTIGPRTGTVTNPNNRGAVGAKGENRDNNKADYINAIYNGFDSKYPANKDMQQNYDSLSTFWPASGDVTRAILLLGQDMAAMGDESWGDGDVDLSKNGRHANVSHLPNRYVNLNDVREIMRSVVTQELLDSVYKGTAFHADVNHNGRYYFLSSQEAGLFRIPYGQNQDSVSRDTFYLKKVMIPAGTPYAGGFGFSPYYGQNANTMIIDFSALGVPADQKLRTVKVLDPSNSARDGDFDYQVRVAITNSADRDLFWMASDPAINTQIEKISIKIKKSINWKDSLYTDGLEDLPAIIDVQSQIFYEANEQDASIILSYLGGRIPYLPWIYTYPIYDGKGKIVIAPYQLASNIAFDNAEVKNNEVRIPVYFNGIAQDAQSAFFTLNTNIINFESANSDVKVDFSDNRAVIVADGYFSPNAPIAFITVENTTQIEATDVRFDGKEVSNVSYKLNSNGNYSEELLAQNSPNPVNTTTAFEITIPETGNYSLMIYDVNGNFVKEIANGNFVANTKTSFNWDATNANGEKVVEGTYIYKLIGENVSISKKLVVIR